MRHMTTLTRTLCAGTGRHWRRSDLEDGRLPDEITVEWVELGGVRTAKLNYAGAPPG